MSESDRRPGRPKKPVTFDDKQEVRCFKKDKQLWQKAAQILDYKTSDYIRQLVNEDAARVIENDRLKKLAEKE